jgi:glycosyl transferase family 9 (putative heptosyltransferase)
MTSPAALISAARGVGDIVRITPLVRACVMLGYDVDVLIAPDYPDTASLLRGAPDIRDLYVLPSAWNGSGVTDVDGLRTRRYDVAVYTVWTATCRSLVQADREILFDRATWFVHGDSACVEATACVLGWSGPLPQPFVMTSGRRFGLPAGTVALHPGCKPDWPWKKWHGFDELAARLPHVAIVGTATDVDNRATYFGRAFAWPPHARSFVGALTLPDTAALLSECAALVSNDSGLMHVGAALGILTLGIFGITSPAREALPVANMIAVEKGLSCQPACRRGPWGRRDCEHHLECLRALTAADVAAAMDTGNAIWRTH